MAIYYLTNQRTLEAPKLKYMAAAFLDLRFPTLASVESRLEVEGERIASERSQLEAEEKQQEKQREAEAEVATEEVRKLVRVCIDSHGEGSEEVLQRLPAKINHRARAKLSEVLKLRDLWESTKLYEDVQNLLQHLEGLSIEKQAIEYPNVDKLRIALAKDWLSQKGADLAMQATDKISQFWMTLCSELRKALESSLGDWPKVKPTEEFWHLAEVAENVDTLVVYDILAQPLVKRIKFHFGNPRRDTHRPDKPQWMLDFVLRKQLEPAREMGVNPTNLWEALCPYVVDSLCENYPDAPLNVHESEVFDTAATELGIKTNLTAAYVPKIEDEFLRIESIRILDSLNGVLDDSSADDVDFDWSGPTKPTFGAHNAMRIWKDALGLVRGLPSSTQHLATEYWLRPLLDKLYSRYVTASETSDIEKLVSTLGSVSYVETVLRTYGAVEVLIPESFEDIAEKFSLFRDEVAHQVARVLRRELQSQLRIYFTVDWSGNEVYTPLGASLDHIGNAVDRVSRVTGPADFLSVIIPFSSAVSDIWWRSVIQANVFSVAGGLRLLEDIDAMWTRFRLAPAQGKRIRSAASYLAGESADLSEEDLSSLRRRRI